ncbi:hypothetical protein [Thiolapillus sp.]
MLFDILSMLAPFPEAVRMSQASVFLVTDSVEPCTGKFSHKVQDGRKELCAGSRWHPLFGSGFSMQGLVLHDMGRMNDLPLDIAGMRKYVEKVDD